MNIDETMWKIELLVDHVKAFASIVLVDHHGKVQIASFWLRNDVKVSTNESIFPWQGKLFSYPPFVPKSSKFQRKIYNERRL